MLNKKAQMDKLWKEMMLCSNEMSTEARRCQGSPTERYTKLKTDMATLKAEYEALQGRGTFDPSNINHQEGASVRSFKDKMLGNEKP